MNTLDQVNNAIAKSNQSYSDIQQDANDGIEKYNQISSDAQGAAQGDPNSAAKATSDALNDIGDIVGGSVGSDLHKIAGTVGQIVGAAVGVAHGDPSEASALATQELQDLGDSIGGKEGSLIHQLAPGLGQAAGALVTIGVGAIDGNDAAVENGEASLASLTGDVISSLGDEIDHLIGGQIGAGIASTTAAGDQASQAAASGVHLANDIQQGDGVAAVQDAAAAAHHAGAALDNAGHAVENFTGAIGLGAVGGVVGDGLGALGSGFNAVGGEIDKVSQTVGTVANLASLPQQIISTVTGDVAKTAAQVGSDVWEGAKNAVGDLSHGNIGDAAQDLGRGIVNAGEDVGSGIVNAGKDALNAAEGAVTGVVNDIGGLFGSTTTTPDPLPPGVHDAYDTAAADSDGNSPLIQLADNGNPVTQDPTTKVWTETDYSTGNVVATFSYDTAHHVWTQTDPNGNVSVYDYNSHTWVAQVNPGPNDVGGIAPPPPPPNLVTDHAINDAPASSIELHAAHLGVATVSIVNPAIDYSPNQSIDTARQGILANTGSVSFEAGIGHSSGLVAYALDGRSSTASAGHADPSALSWSTTLTPIAGNINDPFGAGSGTTHRTLELHLDPPDSNAAHAPSAGVVAIDHLADTVGHNVGGVAGSLLDGVGQALSGVLGNVVGAHPGVLGEAASLLGVAGALTDKGSGSDHTAAAVHPSAIGGASGDHGTPPPDAGSAIDHLADTIGHNVGGVAGSLLDGVGQQLSGLLGNAVGANPGVLGQAASLLGVGPGHLSQSFWDSAAEASHLATIYGPADHAPGTIGGLSASAGAQLVQHDGPHAIELPTATTGSGHDLVDNGHHDAPHLNADHANDTIYPHFELPTLHIHDVAIHL